MRSPKANNGPRKYKWPGKCVHWTGFNNYGDTSEPLSWVVLTATDRRLTPLNYYRFSWAAQLVCYAAPGDAIGEN